MADRKRDTSTICLFDVDGTLTLPRQVGFIAACSRLGHNRLNLNPRSFNQDIVTGMLDQVVKPDMEKCLEWLNQRCVVGLVGGSDLSKISEQMSTGGVNVINKYEHVFSENGLVAHRNGQLASEESIATYMGEEKLQTFINFALKAMSEIKLPCKRGTFIEFRKGLINVCPVGRSCTQAERDQFAAYDKEHKVREKLVKLFQENFPDSGLCFVIGGQISVDVFPTGWDKRYCLKHLEPLKFKTIHFFGDKTQPGENDYEIFADSRTIGHTVTSPDDTMKQLHALFD